MARILRQIKAYLWNGNLHDGQITIGDLVMYLDEVETDYASIKACTKRLQNSNNISPTALG